MGSVWFDRTDGYWRAKVPLPNGRFKRFSAKTKAGAVEKMKAYRPLAPGSDMAFDELLERWLDSLEGKVEAGELTADTLEWKRTVVARADAIGAKRLDQLLGTDVSWLLAKMAEDGKARGTIKHTRGQLVLALNWALSLGLVTHNAAAVSSMPVGIKPSKQKRESMTVREAKALLSAAKGERLEALFVTALLLGLRPGELLGLRWADVDFDRGTISVSYALHRDGTFGDLKTDDSDGVVRTPAPVLDALRSHRARQATERLRARRWTETDAVFATRVGTPTDDSNLRRVNARLCRKAGLGKWTPHEYRHTAASLLLDLGVPREEVRQVLRHKNMRMIDEVYGHDIRPVVGTQAAAAMDRLFGSGS